MPAEQMYAMKVKLLCTDGAEFSARVGGIADVSGIIFRGRYFLFRKFNTGVEEPYCEFEEGRVIMLVDGEVTQESK